MSIIIGIDPGSTTVGYAVIEKNNGIHLIDYGVISTTPKIDVGLKLLEIGNDIKNLIEKFKPQKIVIEKIFFTKNLKTGIDVAQCRGVIVYEAMCHQISILEFTPLQVKKAITGSGSAGKKQMQTAIQMILKLKTLPTPDDAADAIGLAFMGALNK